MVKLIPENYLRSNKLNKIKNTFILTTIFAAFTFAAASDSFAAGDPVKGKESYDNICASCHGATGKGDGVAAAALEPKPRDLSNAEFVSGLSDEHLIKVISKGGTSVGLSQLMPAWEGVLQPEDIQNVVEYIRVDICNCRPK